MKQYFLLMLCIIILFSCHSSNTGKGTGADSTKITMVDSSLLIHFAAEKHLANIRRLTFDGDNAEAYWSWDGTKLIFQRADYKDHQCDQMYYGIVPTDSTQKFNFTILNNGKGRVTCGAFLPGDSLVLYSSTFATADTCPPTPDKNKIKEYIWPLYNSYEIYVSDLKGNIHKRLTNNKFYDAESTISPKGDRIIFTSTRDGDIDLYTMKLDGSDVKRITHELGYDGGAWFSPDGSKIVWRASRPKTPEEVKKYKDLLAQGLVAPTHMQVFTANADGSDVHQVTDMPNANWAPYFTPDGKKIIFASNYEYPHGFPFNLYLVNLDGTGLERLSFSGGFDAFPMFSHDGKHLVFCSSRGNGGKHGINVFVADWVD